MSLWLLLLIGSGNTLGNIKILSPLPETQGSSMVMLKENDIGILIVLEMMLYN